LPIPTGNLQGNAIGHPDRNPFILSQSTLLVTNALDGRVRRRENQMPNLIIMPDIGHVNNEAIA